MDYTTYFAHFDKLPLKGPKVPKSTQKLLGVPKSTQEVPKSTKKNPKRIQKVSLKGPKSSHKVS